MQLNFDAIPNQEPLPEGVYLLMIEHAEEKDTSTGKKMIVVRMREPETNTAVFCNCVLDPSCLFRLKQFTDAVGLELEGDFDSSDIVEALPGNEVQAKITQREYNGDIRNEVKKVMPA